MPFILAIISFIVPAGIYVFLGMPGFIGRFPQRAYVGCFLMLLAWLGWAVYNDAHNIPKSAVGTGHIFQILFGYLLVAMVIDSVARISLRSVRRATR